MASKTVWQCDNKAAYHSEYSGKSGKTEDLLADGWFAYNADGLVHRVWNMRSNNGQGALQFCSWDCLQGFLEVQLLTAEVKEENVNAGD